MLAAIAVADITPPIGTPLQGHYSPHPESRGILAPLEIRTIVFRSGKTTLAIITADLTGTPWNLTSRVREAIESRYGIKHQNILVVASHTHCGPATAPNLALKPIPEILQQIEQAMITSVGDAIKELEPVTLGIGAAAAHFNVNRRPASGGSQFCANDGGVVDRRVRTLRIDRANGSPLVVLFHYSCHPTTKYGSDGLISPDYPGFARTRIEQQLGCRAAFLSGCCGNIRPNIVGADGNFVSATPEQLTVVGDELADAVIRAVRFTRTIEDDRLAVAETNVFFPYGSMMAVEEMEKLSKRADQARRAEWAKRNLPQARSGLERSGENSLMQAMRIGPVGMVAIPGEPMQEIGYEIERISAGKFPDVWPIGYANDKIGYLCTPRMYQEGGYEPTAYIAYDRPAPFKDEQRIIAENATKLIAAVSG
ncbi:MAG TPA: neutral/alkaline non-lysosomal ceramidase N-terminal domain-containing protein [Tepidisphaeraceae bacterium]|nr:neutral/alkaline non-lysosomal ceramidase N-terminal domain-containing protein [Tepidisphaeraceae bacterium]